MPAGSGQKKNCQTTSVTWIIAKINVTIAIVVCHLKGMVKRPLRTRMPTVAVRVRQRKVIIPK